MTDRLDPMYRPVFTDKTVRMMMTFLRRGPETPHFLKEKLLGEEYREYREVWEKDHGDEGPLGDGKIHLPKTSRRVHQYFTGRTLRPIDHVTPEYLEELGMHPDCPPVGIEHVLDHEDFTVWRFKIV